MKPILLLLAILAAMPARADKRYDCRHFTAGETKLTHSTNWYYGKCESDWCLHKHILTLTLRDLQDTSLWSVQETLSTPKPLPAGSTLPPNTAADCAAVLAKGQAYQAAVAEAETLFRDAITQCTSVPTTPDEVPLCAEKAGPALAKEREIVVGGIMDAFVTAAKENYRCTNLDFAGAEANPLGEAAVYDRIKKGPCYRDSRCAKVRIGKLREARIELSKVLQPGKDPPPGELSYAIAACKGLLFNQTGEATPGDPGSGAGAENLLWHMNVFPDFYGVDGVNDPAINIFHATGKIAECRLYLIEGWERSGCQAVWDSDPQAKH